jgi:hypothetical protein
MSWQREFDETIGAASCQIEVMLYFQLKPET